MLVCTPPDARFSTEFDEAGDWLGNYSIYRPDEVYEVVKVPAPYQAGPTNESQDLFWRDFWHDLQGYRPGRI